MTLAELIETHPTAAADTGCLADVPAREAANDNTVWEGEWVNGFLAAKPAPIRPAVQPGLPHLVGITGKRNVGKSTTADLLVSRLGYVKAHAFDGGKEAGYAYLRHVTGDYHLAHRMTWGDLKDVPCDLLPGGVSPRYFYERFGQFMGVDMGVEWTLGMEIARLRREHPGKPIVVESLVYEAGWFRRQGGRILRLVRPDHEGPAGIESDAVQATILADAAVSATSVAELQERVLEVIEGWRIAA
jgi:hypothetical protein